MKDIKFDCPHCKQPLEASEDLFGESIPCPSCNSELTVPFPSSSYVTTNANKPISDNVKTKTQMGKHPLWIWYSSGIAAALVVATTVVFVAIRRDGADSQTYSVTQEYSQRVLPRKGSDDAAHVNITAMPATTTTEQYDRKWWIATVGLIMSGGIRSINMVIASSDGDFLDNLSSSSWQDRNTSHPDISKSTLLLMLPHMKTEDIGGGIKGRVLQIAGFRGGYDELLETSIRLNGDSEWILLSDIIAIDEAEKQYYISRCLRCTSVLTRGTEKCSRCQARFRFKSPD